MQSLDSLAEDYSSPYPECRVSATADPWSMVCLDLGFRQAERLLNRAMLTYENTSEFPYEVLFVVPREFAESLHNRFRMVLDERPDGVVALQVRCTPNPAFRVSVVLNESQVEDTYEQLDEELIGSDPENDWGWKVPLSESGNKLLVWQLRRAFDGEEEPLEAVKEDLDR
jgi:hypothetical protein